MFYFLARKRASIAHYLMDKVASLAQKLDTAKAEWETLARFIYGIMC